MSLIVSGPYTQLTAPTRRGFGTPFCQRTTGRWSPTGGWTFDQEFRGFDLGLTQNLANLYGNAGIEYELTYQNGVATLRTIDTTGNITIDVWEISASQQITSLFKNPLWVTALSANDYKVMVRAYLAGIDLKSAVAALNSDVDDGGAYTLPDVKTAGAAQRFYDKIKNNEDSSYFTDVYTLRHCTNASNRGFYNVA
ncbi:MAG: hypothetical protein WCS42_13085, partial [Verrucomicrobiota bacterium]